jgi:hypothetical protein
MPNITSIRLLTAHRIGKREVAWTVEFTDSRVSSAVRLTIKREELRFPDNPTLLGIETACIRRGAANVGLYDPARPAPKKIRKPTQSELACKPIAELYGADVGAMVDALPQAHAEALAEWESSDCVKIDARKQAARHLELSSPRELARFVSRIENNYKDHSSVTRFDEFASELATDFPSLGFDPSDCCHEVWQLLRETPARKPGRFSPAVLNRAAELALLPADCVTTDDSVPF